jgi:hypothetical protein
MSERPTPETDACIIERRKIHKSDGSVQLVELIDAEFARRLERERDEARDKYDALATEHMLAVNKLCEERDEAREKAQRLRVQLNHYTQANEMAEQAFRERDEAHKIAEQAIDDLAWFNETNAQRLRNELEQLKDEKN